MIPERAGPVLVLLGLLIVAFGLLAWMGGLSWFGRLPGDVRVERDGFRLFVPITSMLLVSVAATLLVNLLRRMF
jgi:hypothetical protein